MKPKSDVRRVAVRAVAKVGSKGRVYLPPEIREMLKLEEGQYVLFREERGKVYVEKVV